MPVDGLPTTVNYEQASNRITSIVPNASTGINPANPNFEYDPAGNQTRVIQSNGTAQRYCYDAAGRLSQVKADDGTTVIASYGYGASNQRLKQTEGSTTICYAWAGNSIIGEYLDNGSTLAWQKCYVYLGNRLLATQVPGTATSATQFHHPDRLGTRVISKGVGVGAGAGSRVGMVNLPSLMISATNLSCSKIASCTRTVMSGVALSKRTRIRTNG